jgi:hypothetical protein
VSEVLKMLKDDYGLYSYFNGDTLVSGKIYTDNPNNEVVKYALDGARKNIISNDLKYHTKDMIKIKVRMTSHNAKGKKVSVVVGDDDGQEQKLVCSNIQDKKTLEALAKKELDRLKYDGFQGGLVTFGIPFVKHGYTASIENTEFKERSGDYYIDSITTTLNDMGALHRNTKIGPRAAKQN